MNSNSRRSEMAMRAALLNPHATTTEIQTTLQKQQQQNVNSKRIPSPVTTSFPANPPESPTSGRKMMRGLKRVAHAVRTASIDDGGSRSSWRSNSISAPMSLQPPISAPILVDSPSRAVQRPPNRGRSATASTVLQRTNSIHGKRSPMALRTAGRLRSGTATNAASFERETSPVSARSEDGIRISRPPTKSASPLPPPPPPFNLYPNRDRSLTLPSNDLSAPPMIKRQSSTAEAPLVDSSTIHLDISMSPLFKPHHGSDSADLRLAHSAGDDIHKQAIQNLSASSPVVAVTASEPRMDYQPLSRVLLTSRSAASSLSGGEGDESDHEELGIPPPLPSRSKPQEQKPPPLPSRRSRPQDDDTGAYLNDMPLASSNSNTSRPQLSNSMSCIRSVEQSSSLLPVREEDEDMANSHVSLPARPVAAVADLESKRSSPASPFSFSHSRYSLVNQDGSLNMASYQFGQLEGYQKRLSVSTNSSSLDEPSGCGASSHRHSTGGNGFWSSLAASVVSSDVRERSLSPQRKSFASSINEEKSSRRTMGKIVRKVSATHSRSSFIRSSASHSRNPSVGSLHSIASASGSRYKQPQQQQQQQQQQQGNSDSSGSIRSSRLRLPSSSATTTTSATADLAIEPARPSTSGSSHIFKPIPIGVIPFDQVYQSTMAASISLDRALSMAESSGPANQSMLSINHTPQLNSKRSHRRLHHKRTVSVFTESELDNIMVQTAEASHSIQMAINIQHQEESGLRQWINGVLGVNNNSETLVSLLN